MQPDARSALGVLGGMLDHGHHPGRHEAGRADGPTGPGHLGDFHRPRGVGDLDASSGSGGPDVEALHAVTHVDDDLDPVSLHERQWYDDRRGRPDRRARPAAAVQPAGSADGQR